MSSAVIAVRKAALARLQAGGAFPDGEQVLDHMPSASQLALPYIAFEECRVVGTRVLNKGAGTIRRQKSVELLFQVVTTPHLPTDSSAKTMNDLVDEVDTVMAASELDLSTYGRTLRPGSQDLGNVQAFLAPGPMAEELKIGRMIWTFEVL